MKYMKYWVAMFDRGLRLAITWEGGKLELSI